MSHFISLMKGKKEDLDSFYFWMVRKHYQASHPNKQGLIQPNLRHVRLHEISVPSEQEELLEGDFSPYNVSFGNRHGVLKFGLKCFQLLFGYQDAGILREGRIEDRWREYLHLVVLGKKVEKKGEVITTKYLVLMEGMKRYLDEYYDFLVSGVRDGAEEEVCTPVVHEYRLYDISLFDSCAGQLMHDLSPYSNFTGNKLVDRIIKWTRKYLKLENTGTSSFTTVQDEWRKDMKVVVLGKKEDPWINGVEMI